MQKIYTDNEKCAEVRIIRIDERPFGVIWPFIVDPIYLILKELIAAGLVE